MSEFLTRDGEETDDDEEQIDADPTAAPPVVAEDVFAVITPVNGVVQCGEYRWRIAVRATRQWSCAHEFAEGAVFGR